MSTTSFPEEESLSSTKSHESHDNLRDNLLDDLDSLSLHSSQANGRHQSLPSPTERPSPRPPGNARLVIAIDYGTTFTGLATATTYSDHVDLAQIEVLQDWTSPKKSNNQTSQSSSQHKSKMSNLRKVPSVISFTKPTQGEAQWGADHSANAMTLANTKLELQTQNLYEELDLTLHLLKGIDNLSFEYVRKAGPEPTYPVRSPTQIITCYLTKIFEAARKVIDIEQLSLTKTVVDLVVTVPVDWSYQANDAMFKAIRGAGFNKDTFPTLKDTILVSEPEAASYFTARDLHERGVQCLEVDDCFVLCDAGGGTTDTVSFQVKNLKPHFELQKATKPAGGKCGSALIDTAFKEWLRSVIGKDRYYEIDPANSRSLRISPHTTESGPMRDLIKRFETKKKAYPDPNEVNIKLDLPSPLHNLTIEGKVKEGELTISRNEMKKLMDSCVNGAVELIENQVMQVSDVQRRRVRNVFLVGGFGASPYLQKELEESLEFSDIVLRRPDPDRSLTATVQGAVICTYTQTTTPLLLGHMLTSPDGIEKSLHSDCRYMGAITKSYGVVLEGKFEWLMRKGDMILSNEKRTIESKVFWCPWRDCVNNKCSFSVYYYRARSKDDDKVPQYLQNGIHDVQQVGLVTCDFKDFNYPTSLTPANAQTGHPGDKIGPLNWHLQVGATAVLAELFLRDKSLGKCDFKTETDFGPARRSSTSSFVDSDD